MNYDVAVLQKVTAELERRRHTAELERQRRHDKAVELAPEIIACEQELSKTGLAVVKAMSMGENADEYIRELAKINLLIQDRIKQLLIKAGLPEDYLVTHYTCKKCSDTGFVEGRACSCRAELLKQTALGVLSKNSRALNCSFANFDISLYPDEIDERYGISAQKHMADILEYCRSYAEDFDTSSQSLYMHGATGLGKTHLSLAIAGCVTQRGYNVIYGSCQNLLSKLERERFGGYRDASGTSFENEILDCDLLIIDDLGSEFSTNFTTAAIYNIINTRINRSLPVIISTNLTIKELEAKYTQRIASRIIGGYTSLLFTGRDIRQIKNNY